MDTGWALVLSALLLAGNAFFVAAEFALVASRGYRLEQAAAAGSRPARAALHGTRELSLMLAGAQLGVTLCTLGLGALAEPALAHTIDPVLRLAGLPTQTSYAIAFVLSLLVVVFLHIVVGEMVPKSWAISHPERSAILLAPAFVGFTRLARPVLALLNVMANGLLRLGRVQPQDRLAQAHGPQELAMLLQQSREHGMLEPAQHELLASMLTLRPRRLRDIVHPIRDLVTVGPGASAQEIEQSCRDSGRSRLGVVDADGQPLGLVHVRDAIRATTAGREARADELMTPVSLLPDTTSLLDALAAMRLQRAQLAIVRDGPTAVGFIALEDLLEVIIGDFDDETDTLARRISRRPR